MSRKQNEEYARKAGLPTMGHVSGVVTIVQEHRFRLQDEWGRGYLFTLAPSAGGTYEDLLRWSKRQVPVRVEYEGPPDLGAVAVRVHS